METLRLAKVLIRRTSDGAFLLLQGGEWPERPDRSRQPDLPGGMVEDGETFEQGCVREMQEETGLTVLPNDLQLVYAHSFLHKGHSIAHRMIYLAEVAPEQQIQLSWEHESFKWVTAQELIATTMREPYPEIFAFLKKAGLLD